MEPGRCLCSRPYAETGYANPHAVTSVGGTSYAYDNSGNVTAIRSLASPRFREWKKKVRKDHF